MGCVEKRGKEERQQKLQLLFSPETTILEKREERKEKSEKNKKKRQFSAENCRFFLKREYEFDAL